jgi:uncharacterized membrane protein YvlD (DUF360 family)
VVWLVEAAALGVTAGILPGMKIDYQGDRLVAALLGGSLVIALLNALVRPLFIVLTVPLNAATVGASTLLINALILKIADWLSPAFETGGLIGTIIATLILTAVNTILLHLLSIDEDGSFYTGVVVWLIRHRQRDEPAAAEAGRGIVMLEIDGLSYTMLQKATAEGYMPRLRRLLEEGGHAATPYDCGLPSQTSSCQAGIMYGDNRDIPAFRWYEKERGKLVSSSDFDDAYEMNARLSTGRGLLRNGLGVDNHMAGDAYRTVVVMSALRNQTPERKKRAARALNLFFINPYLFERSVVLALADLAVELWQGSRQRRRNVQPRIDRRKKGYPFSRIATNVLLRDLSTFTVLAGMVRGEPAIYTTYVGYDEVAHHAGPATHDALATLKGLDKHLARVFELAVRETEVGRSYDVFVLSDHGQSWGATFRQRYGLTLDEFFRQTLEGKATVAAVDATEHAGGQTRAFLDQVKGMADEGESGGVRGRALRAVSGTLERPVGGQEPVAAGMDAKVVVAAGGNIANAYFDLRSGKITLPELEEAYPGLVDTIVAHEGVGFVVAHLSDDEAVVVGKGGVRELATGTVEGDDPLARYDDPVLRAAQLAYLASFPHAGDLVVISTLYDDGTVAAFEELVGNHGGLGGLQTEPFIVHPADMTMPSTTNSCDVFAVLDGRRGGGPATAPPGHGA